MTTATNTTITTRAKQYLINFQIEAGWLTDWLVDRFVGFKRHSHYIDLSVVRSSVCPFHVNTLVHFVSMDFWVWERLVLHLPSAKLLLPSSLSIVYANAKTQTQFNSYWMSCWNILRFLLRNLKIVFLLQLKRMPLWLLLTPKNRTKNRCKYFIVINYFMVLKLKRRPNGFCVKFFKMLPPPYGWMVGWRVFSPPPKNISLINWQLVLPLC